MRENLDQKHSSHSHEETLEEKLEEMRSAGTSYAFIFNNLLQNELIMLKY